MPATAEEGRHCDRVEIENEESYHGRFEVRGLGLGVEVSGFRFQVSGLRIED